MTPFEIALKEYGSKEIKGTIHNPEILKYSKDINLKWVKDDETAWCAIFVNWCLNKAKLPHTASALARSFQKYGSKTNVPDIGELAIFWRISPTSGFGHVGFFIKETKDLVYVLGGNQSDSVNISAFPKSQLLEYRTIPKIKNA